MSRRAEVAARARGLVWVLGAGLALLGPAAHAVEPGERHAMTPASLGLQAEDVSFFSADSATITGWWFPGGEAAPAVVVAARGSGTMADLLPAVQQFLARGFAVLTFDYRGFGPGATPEARDSLRYVVFDSRWVDDMQGALRYARARGSRRVFAWGQDLGSAVALAGAARDRLGCDALAVEGLFRTSQEVLLANGTSVVNDVAVRQRRSVQGRDEPISAAARLAVPVFVVLAGKDDTTPVETTRMVIGRSIRQKQYLDLPDAGHAGAERSAGYFDAVTQWFRRWMAAPPARAR